MRLKHHRLTVVVVAVWVLALGLTTVFAPVPADATSVQKVGWMTYAPNHPGGCVPMAFDCYVFFVYAD